VNTRRGDQSFLFLITNKSLNAIQEFSREFWLALLHFCSQSFDLTESVLAGAAGDSLREDQGSGGTGLRRPEILSKTILTSTLRIHDDPDTARLVMPSPGSAAENEPTMYRTHTTHSQRPQQYAYSLAKHAHASGTSQ
jgi:hypothetical protein